MTDPSRRRHAWAWLQRRRWPLAAAATAVVLAALVAVPLALGIPDGLHAGSSPSSTGVVPPSAGGAFSSGAGKAGSGGYARGAPNATSSPGSDASTAGEVVESASASVADVFGERQVVRNASVSLEVDSVRNAYGKTLDLVQRYGGYSLEANLYGGTQDQASLQVRVPAAQLEAFLTDVKKLGHVRQLGESGKDVTDQVVDLAARLKVLHSEETRLVGFLDQAKTVEDMLKVEDQLRQTRTQIETLEAQQKALQTIVTMATVSVTLAPIAPGITPATDTDGFIGQLTRVFLVALHTMAFVGSRIALAIVWLAPFAAAAAVVYIAVRLARGRRKNEGAPPAS